MRRKPGLQELCAAAEKDDVRTLQQLIAEGVDIFTRRKDGYAPSYDATRGIAVVQTSTQTKGYTPLHAAARGMGGCVRLLVQSGLDVNVRDEEGRTPLFCTGNPECIRTLVQLGADVSAQDNNGLMALYNPMTGHNIDTAYLFIALGADQYRRDHRGRTPLHQAALGRSSDSLLMLIAYGADVDTQDNDGCTPLQSVENDDYESWHDPSEEQPSEEVIRLLREAGKGVHLRDVDDNTAFTLAAKYDVVEALPMLLQRGADLHATGYNWDRSHKWNALQQAIDKNSLAAAAYLRSLMPPEGICAAIAQGNRTAVLAALEQGLDINTQDAQDMTLLMVAAMYGQTEIVRLLIERGANPYYYDLGGCNALIWTSDPQIATMLLDYDVGIDDISCWHWSPLLAAVKFRRKDMVALLLERGADIALTHRDDLSALKLAYAIGDQEIIELLENYRGDV